MMTSKINSHSIKTDTWINCRISPVFVHTLFIHNHNCFFILFLLLTKHQVKTVDCVELWIPCNY